ncbi:MAG: hypothetical protein WCC17_00225 [Candidatus Nitrosopolaris sp.]
MGIRKGMLEFSKWINVTRINAMIQTAKRHGILSEDGMPMCSICRVRLPLSLMYILHIHHRDGNGAWDRSRYRSNERFHIDIINGRRGTDDLDILCAYHHERYHAIHRKTVVMVQDKARRKTAVKSIDWGRFVN